MKLFKKVAAAVLAGVMALSMVACSTTPGTTPEEKPIDPTLSEEQQFFQALNNKVETVANAMNWGKKDSEKVAFPTFENNAELKAEAEKILDTIAAGKAQYSSTDGKLLSYQLEKAYTLSKGNVHVIKSKSDYVGSLGTSLVFNVKDEDNNDLAFKLDKAQEWIGTGVGTSAAIGDWLIPASKRVTTSGDVTSAYKAKYNFGFASKVINGQTCVIVVWKLAD